MASGSAGAESLPVHRPVRTRPDCALGPRCGRAAGPRRRRGPAARAPALRRPLKSRPASPAGSLLICRMGNGAPTPRLRGEGRMRQGAQGPGKGPGMSATLSPARPRECAAAALSPRRERLRRYQPRSPHGRAASASRKPSRDSAGGARAPVARPGCLTRLPAAEARARPIGPGREVRFPGPAGARSGRGPAGVAGVGGRRGPTAREARGARGATAATRAARAREAGSASGGPRGPRPGAAARARPQRRGSPYCFTLSPSASLKFFLAASSSLTKVAIAPASAPDRRPSAALTHNRKTNSAEAWAREAAAAPVRPALGGSGDVRLASGSARLAEEKVRGPPLASRGRLASAPRAARRARAAAPRGRARPPCGSARAGPGGACRALPCRSRVPLRAEKRAQGRLFLSVCPALRRARTI